MLGGEENENAEKTTIGLIIKKETLHVQHTFFVQFLPLSARLQRKTSRNFVVTRFMEEMSYVFLFTLFQCRSFSPWWPVAFLIFSPPLQNFHVVVPIPLFFISRSSSLLLFSRWASLACRLLSLFLCLSLSLFSKFVDMKINLSFIL